MCSGSSKTQFTGTKPPSSFGARATSTEKQCPGRRCWYSGHVVPPAAGVVYSRACGDLASTDCIVSVFVMESRRACAVVGPVCQRLAPLPCPPLGWSWWFLGGGGGGGGCIRRGGGVSGPIKNVCTQNGPARFSQRQMSFFSRDGHFGLEGGGGARAAPGPRPCACACGPSLRVWHSILTSVFHPKSRTCFAGGRGRQMEVWRWPWRRLWHWSRIPRAGVTGGGALGHHPLGAVMGTVVHSQLVFNGGGGTTSSPPLSNEHLCSDRYFFFGPNELGTERPCPTNTCVRT